MKRINNDQTGMVSLIVSMVLMVILSLIVIGFARTARYEQRQTLDRQLSAQAFYAAESGVNDAVTALNSGTPYPGYDVGGGTDGGTGNKTHCGTDQAGPFGPGSNIVDDQNGHNTRYTCLLITQNPTSLVYRPVGQDQAISADLRFAGPWGNEVDHIDIEWSALSPGPIFTPLPSHPRFPALGGWVSDVALLRMQMTNFDTPGFTQENYSRENLNRSTFTAYLYPVHTGPSNIDFDSSPAAQGEIADAKSCKSPVENVCSITIDNIDSTHVYLRLGSLYRDSQITIRAFANNGSGQQMNIIGGQAVIDSTGQAQDVLRRIQVRLPINTKGGPMNFAVQVVDGLCKNFAIGPGFGADYAPPTCGITP